MRAQSPSPGVPRALECAYLVRSHFELQDLMEGKRDSGASLSRRLPWDLAPVSPNPVPPPPS